MEDLEATLDRMDQWATNLANRFIEKHEHVLDSVCVLAACRFIVQVTRRNPGLLTDEVVMDLLKRELEAFPYQRAKA